MFASRAEQNDNCLGCHQAQRAQMQLPYHHPLREGKMVCVDCHDPHGGPAGNNLRTVSVNQLCLGCHSQYRGPFMYQHPPVTESCLNCHTPHGSPNTNLLSVSEPALCLQCHAGHHNGAGLPLMDRCTNCHGSIHGSDVATASGGSRWIDKGPFGVPGLPQTQLQTSAAQPKLSPHPAIPAGPLAGATGAIGMSLINYLARTSAASDAQTTGPAAEPNTYAAISVTPGAYRFVDVTGYAGRVGEYDSLQQSGGADIESAYVSVLNGLSVVSRANILTGDDYHFQSQITRADLFQVDFDLRSFFQHQDTYPFYSDQIDALVPDSAAIVSPSFGIAPGAVYGIKRRLGKAYGQVKLPNLPVHLFMKGDWQARAGTSQLAWLDESAPSSDPTQCTTCHFTSQFQPVNYTTRNIGGGVEVKARSADLIWEHDFSSFNDRLQFPTQFFGAFNNPSECFFTDPTGACLLPAVAPGNYYLDIPAPNQSSSDTARVNWAASPRLIFNGDVTYTRARDVFTRNPQNAFAADTMLAWHPLDRLQLTADYRQQNLINDFTPYYSLYGNVSYHQHSAGLRLDYELTKQLDVETRYERGGVSRSNSFLWPQAYSVDNTDLLYVVPSTSSNTLGLSLRYHPRRYWTARAGYEWTGTHNPGFLIIPESNNRTSADLSLFPIHWLSFTNDISILVQNAFPAIPLPNQPGALPTVFPNAPPVQTGPADFQRRNRFYSETADATLLFGPNWNLELGYSYQQNNLSTYMAFSNDSSAAYVLDEPFVPYKQLSQTYWTQLASKFLGGRAGWNARVNYNSARSGFRPDLNTADAASLGNSTLIQQQAFDPLEFQLAMTSLQLGATQVSQVIVPEWNGQTKAYYLLPRGFNTGLIFYYGSYKDYLNPGLNGVLRTFSVYIGRSW